MLFALVLLLKLLLVLPLRTELKVKTYWAGFAVTEGLLLAERFAGATVSWLTYAEGAASPPKTLLVLLLFEANSSPLTFELSQPMMEMFPLRRTASYSSAALEYPVRTC